MENLTHKQSWADRNLPRLAKARPEVAAPVLDRHVRWMEQRDKRQFVEWGHCFLMVEQRELWKHLSDASGVPYRGFDAWVMSAAPYGRATAYEALGAIKALREIPMEQLAQVPRSNIKVLKMLPTRQIDGEILAAAKSQSEKQFRRTARTRFPDSHIEMTEPMKLKPESSQREIIDFGLEVAQYVFHTSNREQSLESIIVAWLDSPCGEEGYGDMTNREFYEARTMPARTMEAHA